MKMMDFGYKTKNSLMLMVLRFNSEQNILDKNLSLGVIFTSSLNQNILGPRK